LFQGCAAKTIQNSLQKFQFFYFYNWVTRAAKAALATEALGVRANLFVGYIAAVGEGMGSNWG
tara:strand:- start:702 stop:890 length:189 start_codon:yes stop_codon:yes gene_type:complete